MLMPLLGSENSERVLIFMLTRETGYAREIAQFFDTNLYAIQKQLDKLEAAAYWSVKRQEELVYTSSILAIPS